MHSKSWRSTTTATGSSPATSISSPARHSSCASSPPVHVLSREGCGAPGAEPGAGLVQGSGPLPAPTACRRPP
jgi:hypothetical protein